MSLLVRHRKRWVRCREVPMGRFSVDFRPSRVRQNSPTPTPVLTLLRNVQKGRLGDRMINRRRALILYFGAIVVPLASFGQQPQGKVARVGFLVSETLSSQAGRIEALRAGLSDRGYVEGNSIAIEL